MSVRDAIRNSVNAIKKEIFEIEERIARETDPEIISELEAKKQKLLSYIDSLGNNMAAGLEEKTNRSAAETELMLRAAAAGRKFWEIAGTWLETERAEYRWSRSCLAAGDAAGALEHARACLAICERERAEALELFCAHEALVLAERAAGKAPSLETLRGYFEKLADEDKSWCEARIC